MDSRTPPPKWSRRQQNIATFLGLLGLVLWIGTPVLNAATGQEFDFFPLPQALFVLACYVVLNLRAVEILDFFGWKKGGP